MSRLPVLSLAGPVALSLVLSGCDAFTPPPAQLQAALTLTTRAATESDQQERRRLADNIVRYLAIKGVDDKNARVTFDETSKTHRFEIFGRQPIPPALLDQVAKAIDPAQINRSWDANVTVDPLEHFDALLGTKERSFPVRASWKNIGIDAYVVQMPGLGSIIPTISPNGEIVREPKTARCMLSFKPQPALPKLEGTVEQVYGSSSANRSLRLALRLQPDQVVGVPHKVTFDDAVLAKAFKEEPLARDGKLMFEFAELNDVNVLDFNGSEPAIDMGGATQAKCLAELIEKYPDIANIVEQMSLLESIKSFGPARIIPLPVAAR